MKDKRTVDGTPTKWYARTKAEKANAAFQAQVERKEEQRNRRIVLDELAVRIPTNQLHEYELTKKG